MSGNKPGKKMTMGIIVGNRGFFPDQLAKSGREEMIQALAKAGTLAIVGVYPAAARSFPIGAAMNRNLTLRMGNCPHRRYVPKLLELIASGVIEPTKLLTQSAPLSSAIEAYEAFDQRRPGWLKVKLEPQRAAMPRAA